MPNTQRWRGSDWTVVTCDRPAALKHPSMSKQKYRSECGSVDFISVAMAGGRLWMTFDLHPSAAGSIISGSIPGDQSSKAIQLLRRYGS